MPRKLVRESLANNCWDPEKGKGMCVCARVGETGWYGIWALASKDSACPQNTEAPSRDQQIPETLLVWTRDNPRTQRWNTSKNKGGNGAKKQPQMPALRVCMGHPQLVLNLSLRLSGVPGRKKKIEAASRAAVHAQGMASLLRESAETAHDGHS